MSFWAFLSALSAAWGLFTWPVLEVLKTEHTHDLITPVCAHTHTHFPVRKHIFYSLTAGREYCCYKYCMCVACVYSDVRAPPSTINSQRTHRTNVSFVPLKSTAHWHPLLLFISAHIHTHPSLHPPMAFSTVLKWCCRWQKQLYQRALLQQERHSTNYSTG